MNPTIQFGTHPDAESLTAFAEQSLSAKEREQILAHMAVCSRCREVVFLSQQAAESEQPAEVVQQQDSHLSGARRWFSSWRWAWVPVAAMAGFVGVAIVQHTRHVAAPPQQVAQFTPETAPVRNSAAEKSAESPAPPQQQASKPYLSTVREKEDQLASRDGRAFDDKQVGVAKQKDLQICGSAGAFGAGRGVSGGSSSGMVAARKAAPSMGGPAALNQLQQNANQMQLQNNVLQSRQQANDALKAVHGNNTLSLDEARQAPPAASPANKPAPPPPGSVTETVNVTAEPVVPAYSLAAAAPVPQIAQVKGKEETAELKKDSLAKFTRRKVALPGDAEALSTASAGSRTVAIDTTGALFLSQDSGKHWQSITTQWTGRAVLVRAKQTGLHGGILAANEQPQFELVTDKLETWSSPDGTTWTLEPAVAK